MFGQAVTAVVAAGATAPVQTLVNEARDELLTAAGITTIAIAAIGAAAFGIKGLWVGWRGASKAVGKTGT